MDRTIVFYHGSCPDGFGAAYAAWKKFGEGAEYIPLNRNDEEIPDVTGADLFFLDFVYNKEKMDEFVTKAKSVTVLDHHEGVRDIIESMPTFRYSEERSGATLSWEYFHPDTPTPTLLQHIEDDDVYRFALPDTRAILAYLGVNPFTFAFWDEVCEKLENPATSSELLQKVRAYGEYFVLLAEYAANNAKLVSFEGHEVYFGTAHPYKPMKSMVGHLLAKKKGPFALVVAAHPRGYGVSIRGDGTLDLSKIAAKYGGNGHFSSAGFVVSAGGPLPWTEIEEA